MKSKRNKCNLDPLLVSGACKVVDGSCKDKRRDKCNLDPLLMSGARTFVEKLCKDQKCRKSTRLSVPVRGR